MSVYQPTKGKLGILLKGHASLRNWYKCVIALRHHTQEHTHTEICRRKHTKCYLRTESLPAAFQLNKVIGDKVSTPSSSTPSSSDAWREAPLGLTLPCLKLNIFNSQLILDHADCTGEQNDIPNLTSVCPTSPRVDGERRRSAVLTHNTEVIGTDVKMVWFTLGGSNACSMWWCDVFDLRECCCKLLSVQSGLVWSGATDLCCRCAKVCAPSVMAMSPCQHTWVIIGSFKSRHDYCMHRISFEGICRYILKN